MTFYTKPMRFAEWPAFQDWFADFQMVVGAPDDMALFHRNEEGAGNARVAVSGVRLARLQENSPDGWEEVEQLTGPGWGLLVGNGDVAARLNVPIGS